MPAVQELLVDVFVTTAAIASSQVIGGDGVTVVVPAFLPCRRLVAVETVHALPSVLAHFVLVNNRVLSASVTLRALTGGAHKLRVGLLGFNPGPGAVQQKRGQDQRESDGDGDKD